MSDRDQGCLACAAKDLQIIWLRQRIVILEREVKRLRGIIERAKVVCVSIAGDADKIMSSHQPRAVWAFARGAKRTALEVLSVLG